jgi:hypothetical protein
LLFLISDKRLPKYNGNIAEVDWRSVENLGNNPSLTPKRYGYVYDGLNRLTAGYYQNPQNPNSKENTESLTYDLNGNITGLYRTSVTELGNTTPTLIDKLEYIYPTSSNKLTNINDYANNATGYEGGGQEIHYDLNGNMIDMPDKGIGTIQYNYLNLSNKLEYNKDDIKSVSLVTKYGANGEKLRKENTTAIVRFSGITVTKKTNDYLDGFQYLKTEQISGPTFPGGGGGGGSSYGLMAGETSLGLERQAYTLNDTALLFDPSPPSTNIKTADLQFFPPQRDFMIT